MNFLWCHSAHVVLILNIWKLQIPHCFPGLFWCANQDWKFNEGYYSLISLLLLLLPYFPDYRAGTPPPPYFLLTARPIMSRFSSHLISTETNPPQPHVPEDGIRQNEASAGWTIFNMIRFFFFFSSSSSSLIIILVRKKEKCDWVTWRPFLSFWCRGTRREALWGVMLLPGWPLTACTPSHRNPLPLVLDRNHFTTLSRKVWWKTQHSDPWEVLAAPSASRPACSQLEAGCVAPPNWMKWRQGWVE